MRTLIVSVPKSGTNLVSAYLAAAKLRKAAFIGGVSANVLAQISVLLGHCDSSVKIGLERPVNINKKLLKAFIRCSSMRGCYWTTHSGYTPDLYYLLEPLIERIIVVTRNPLDCFQSWLRYTNMLSNLEFEYQSVSFIADRYFFGGKINNYSFLPISTRYNSILAWRKEEGSVFIDFDVSVERDDYLEDKLFQAGIPRLIKEQYFGKSKTFRTGKNNQWRNNAQLNFWVENNYEKLKTEFSKISHDKYREII